MTRMIRTEYRIMGLSALAGAIVWVAMAYIDSAVFGQDTFWKQLSLQVPLHQAYMRVVALLGFVAFGVFLARGAEQRRKIEESLEESEARYRTLVQFSPYAVIVHEEERIVFVNDAAVKLLGARRKEELVGRHGVEFTHPDFAASVRERLASVMSEGMPTPVLEEKFIRLDGVERYADVISIRIQHEGKPAILTMARDVTGRRRTHELLDAERRQLLSIFDSMDHLVYVSDPKTHEILYANRVLRDTFGEVVGQPCHQALQGLSEPCPFCPDAKIFNDPEGRAYIYEVQSCITQRWYRCIDKAIRWPDGRRVRCQLALDITEHREAEKALRASEQFNREIIAGACEGIVVYDPQLRYLVWNPFMERMTGLPAEQVLGRNGLDLFPHLRENGVDRLLARALKGETVEGPDTHYRLPQNGREGWTSTVYSPHRNAEGEIVGAIGIITDITHRKAAEEALRRGEESYRRLVQSANSIIYRRDVEGRITFVNEFAQKFFGFTEAELVGRHVIGTIVPQRDASGRDLEEMVRDISAHPERYVRNENENIRRNGERAWIAWTNQAIRDEQGRVTEVLCIGNDITERKRAAEALQAEAALWQQTFDAIEDAVALISRDLRIVRANAAMRRYFPGQTIVGEHCHTLFHGDSRLIAACAACDVFRSGEAARKEALEPGPAGRWLDVRAYPVKGRSGATDQVVHILRDISAGKRNEEEREATLRLLRLVNTSRDAQELVKLATLFLRDWAGCAAVEVRLRQGDKVRCFETRDFPPRFSATELAVPSDEEAPQCLCGAVLCGTTGLTVPGATEYGSFWTNNAADVEAAALRDGRAGWCEHCRAMGGESAALIPLRSGRETFGLLHISHAAPGRFTPERIVLLERLAGNLAIGLAHHRAQGESALLSSAVNQAAEAIVITDPEGVIQHVNPAFERITGYEADEAIGRNLLFLSGEGEGEAHRDLWDALRAGAVWAGHLTSRRKDGTPLEEEASLSPVRNGLGKITNFVLVRHDTTREVALEAQFRHAQKMEAVGRLAGGVAHDFNNLLTAIIGYSDLIASRLGEENPIRRDVAQIRKAGDRAAALTRQLLAFSRKQVLQPKVLDLNAAVGDIEKLLRRLIGEDIELAILRAPGLAAVKADPGQIEQVVMNLVVNARDAMPKGGRITIETANVTLDEAFVERHMGARTGPHVALAVHDTGTGMSTEVLAHVFEPFFTTKDLGKGTGLGLCTVYGIVTQSGGYITVESEEGHGATFTIYLPVVEEQDRSARVEGGERSTRRGSETVLLVEDEEVVRSLALASLRARGYTVLEAGNGDEALALARAKAGPIHLMVTDVVMPGMSGHELARLLAAERPEMRVLFMSGYADSAALAGAHLPPHAAFLPKPFTPDALARRVEELLGA